ncbi:MAG: AsmA family protein [Janthinobacterium lividum]
MPRWLKNILKTLVVIVGLVAIAVVAVSLYISSHKNSILADITKQLNKNLNGGSLSIQSMDPTFLSDFPRISLSLKNVVLKDSLWKVHHHTLLEAQELSISVNTFALFKGTIEIYKAAINKANVYLYTDSTGYTNTSVFKKEEAPKNIDKSSKGASTQIKRINLDDVKFVMDNQKGHKLFNFNADELKGKIDYPSEGWKANLRLKVLANSMAFNTLRGSFIKNKLLDGTIAASFDEENGVITVVPNTLNIGKNPFIISGKFNTIKNPGSFALDITANNILWRDAAVLLAPNITEHLNMFDIKKPIDVNALIAGSFNAGGDPNIDVKCKVNNNTLTTPVGVVDSCSFHAAFTNGFVKSQPLSDENSAISVYQLSGNYEQVPFKIDTGIIMNLVKTEVQGTLKSQFAVKRLNHLLDETMNFTNGSANLNLRYKANVVDFKFIKPVVSGAVDIRNADVNYIPRNIQFKNTSISLNFAGDDLLLKNIHLQSGKSNVYMEGTVRNFLNLYYTDPEKILINWQIRSPELYLGEFFGFLSKKQAAPKKKKSNSTFGDQLSTVLQKSKADMHLHVDNAHYLKFLATNVNADLLLSEAGINLKDVGANLAGGSFKLNGRIDQRGNTNHFAVVSNVNNVNISNFFYSFNNFGMKSFTYQNLKGFLSLNTSIAGNVSDLGSLIPKSLLGTVNLNLRNGALVNFAPIKNVGKFAFPFRDLDNITLENLNGKFDIRGDKIKINPMMINSSVLNMNVAGIYSLSTGTNIALDVPLRNPKKDEDITSKQEKNERRMRGIVLHILASDGEDGKIKIGWNRNHD